jgi:hypothetical protein
MSKFPGPNNAKMRGIEAKISQLHERGIKSVASQDTRISRIGWGISWVAKKYDMKHYNFYPATGAHGLPFYQKMSTFHGGEVIPIHGTFASGFRALCERHLKKHELNPYFFPIGASLDETLIEISNLVPQLPSDVFEGTVVVNVSSGTICAGLSYGCLKNGFKPKIIGVQGSAFKNRKEKIFKKIQSVYGKKIEYQNLELKDPGYQYRESEPYTPPFPCDLYLDRKAWKWLVDNINILPEPISFWNIGGEWDPIKGLSTGLRGDGEISRSEVYKCIRD